MERLTGRVAVVAGGARGAGRGIARMLGERGAVVYVTGRSGGGVAGPSGRPETIEETAALVDAAGGEGVAVRVDHADGEAVGALFERVKRERGRLDVLVNVLGGPAQAWQPFWKQSLEAARGHLEGWLWTHMVTVRQAAPLMVAQGSGLMVEVCEHDTIGFQGSLFYDVARVGAMRLAYGAALEMSAKGVTVLAVTPGFMRTEAVLAHFGATEETWREAAETKEGRRFLLAESETPCFVGRAIAALAADPEVHRKSGGLFSSWGLSEEYGFRDVDGGQPHWGRAFAAHGGPPSVGGPGLAYAWSVVPSP